MSWTLFKEIQLRYWQVVEKLSDWFDEVRFRYWQRFHNGCNELRNAYEAVDDAKDCLESIGSAIADHDYDAALRLIELSRERLDQHVETLRGLL